MTMGGEETDPSERRRSRDSRRSIDVMRKSVEIPHRIKDRIKHRHSSYEKAESPKTPIMPRGAPTVITRYLLISPVLLPFSDHLLPPGAQTWAHSSGKADAGSDRQFLLNPTLAVFGTNDGFTASKRLKRWAEKQDNDTSSDFQWSAIETAGHFWREESVLQALQQRIVRWAKEKR